MWGTSAGRVPLLSALRQGAAHEDRGVLPGPPRGRRRRPPRLRLPDRAETHAPQRLARRGGAGRDLARPVRERTAGALPRDGRVAPAPEPRLAGALAPLGNYALGHDARPRDRG